MQVKTWCYTVLIAVAFGSAVPGRAQSPLDKLRQAAQERARQAQQKAQQQQQQPQQQQAQRPGQPGPGSAGSQPAPAAPAGQPLNANVQTALMGPTVGGVSTNPVYMSDDGNHLAIQTAKGSRQVIIVDGVEGPVFDEFLPHTRLSPSGGRSAYLGRRGEDYIAVVDGKEAGTVSRMPGIGRDWDFWFSRDGSRLAYPVINETGSWSMMVDGTKGQAYPQFDLTQTVLNGKRLAYVAQTPDKKWHVVIDGKQGPGYDAVASLKMTPDGAHYAFFATAGNSRRVVLDGVEGKPYPALLTDLELAPDGRVAYMASMPSTGLSPTGRGPALLVLGGQEIPNTSTFILDQGPGGHPSFHVAFSPDGKRVAYVKQNVPSPGLVVVVDGKAGPEYTSIGLLQFSPDGRRLFYMAGANGLTFPVIDGQELQGDNGITDFLFSPDGKRYAFRTWLAAQNGGFAVLVDGKESPKSKGDIYAQSLTFSPDSKHYAYGAALNITSFQPVVDGEVRSANLGVFQTKSNPGPSQRITFPVFNFSPDGTRLAFVGQKLDGTGKASLILDGVSYEGVTALFSFPSYSPDSKHFAWIVGSSRNWTLMVDGKAGPVYDDMLENSVAGCRFVDNHTFRFYGIKNNQIYRVTVDIGN